MSSSLDLLIRGASVLTPEGFSELQIGVADGHIVALAPEIELSAAKIIEASGERLVPGMIDAHVHFNEPGRTEWEGFATGSRAAAAGGVTMLFDMPLNSTPATLTPAAFHQKADLAKAKSVVPVRLWGGLVPGNLDQLEALHKCGVIGFKAFMSNSGIEEFARVDAAVLKAGMKIVSRLPGMRVAVHAEDEALTAQLAGEARERGQTDPRSFAASRPIAAEVIAIRVALELAGETRCPLHVVHVSSAEGLAEISKAKTLGVNVTAETCPHYFVLTEDAMERSGALAKCAPPLRSAVEQDRLWEALKRGEVDTIGSDHSPCLPSMKFTPTFAEAWGGISGVQHALALTYSAAEEHGVAAEKVAAWLSSSPANVFGLGSTHGRIALGARADFCLLHRSANEKITADDLLYRHKYSPYVGLPLVWHVIETWVHGKSVFREPNRV